jgi:hypothetical protein
VADENQGRPSRLPFQSALRAPAWQLPGVHPDKRADWVPLRSGATIKVKPANGSADTDTLTRIQTAKFDDQTLDPKSQP